MTLVNMKQRPEQRNFNNVIETFFTGFPSVFQDDFAGTHSQQTARANVKETEDHYQLELVAPGFEKEDFKIDLNNNLLTISGDVKAEGDENKSKYVRQEFKVKSFKRSFTVDEKIDVTNIDAKYVNGVLTVNLPKKAEEKATTKQITIQ